jgi:hypothetical protein
MPCRQRLRDARRRQGQADEFTSLTIDSAAVAGLMLCLKWDRILCLKWDSWLLAEKKIPLLNAVIERDPDMNYR